jgi:hypothetical protein
MPTIALMVLTAVFLVPKSVLKAAANDLYTVLMVSMVIYALSFMCQQFEREMIKIIILVMFADGIMKIVTYILGA